MTAMCDFPASAPINMSGRNNMFGLAYLDTSNYSHYDESNGSVDEHMDSATIDPKAALAVSPFDNDMFGQQFDTTYDFMGAALGDMQIGSPVLTTTPPDEQPDALDASVQDMQSMLNNTHAAPWNAAIPRSDPMSFSHHLHVPGQPKSAFLSLPTHFGESFGDGSYTDSAYVSGRPAPDTASFYSMPAAQSIYSQEEDCVSDVFDNRPKKKQKKTFHCSLSGEHKTRDFANIHDLERHQRSIHGFQPKHSSAFHYQCPIKDCRNKSKFWDRKDNFKSHIERKHFPGRPEEFRAQIDRLVVKSKRELSTFQLEALFEDKQRQKRHSKQTATRRKNRRSSARSTSSEAAHVRHDIGFTSSPTSGLPSAIDDAEMNVGFNDVMFDGGNYSTLVNDPARVALYNNMGMSMTGTQSHDLW